MGQRGMTCAKASSQKNITISSNLAYGTGDSELKGLEYEKPGDAGSMRKPLSSQQ
jgi:hypothetical protein